MSIRILPQAEQEFAAEVAATLERISDFPETWPKISRRARRCMTNKYPFGVIYQIRKDCILVLALMHMKRDPRSWRERVE